MIVSVSDWKCYTFRMEHEKQETQRIRDKYIDPKRPRAPIFSRVDGACMEGLNVYDGDHLVIDPTKRPRQTGDVCLIAATVPTAGPSQLKALVKSYYGCYCQGHWVRTCYTDRKQQTIFVRPFGFIGVAFACYSSDWRLRWVKDISDYPEELETAQTLAREPSSATLLMIQILKQEKGEAATCSS